MRPSFEEVRDWFAGDLADAVLRAHLAVLQADPNWRVTSQQGAGTCDLNLLYGPTGQRLDVHLSQVEHEGATMWRQAP